MTATAPITLSDLMAKTGYFLSYWSLFEIALGKAIADGQVPQNDHHHKMPGGLKERLRLWVKLVRRSEQAEAHIGIAQAMRTDALRLRDIRNVIVHGLALGDAHPKSGAPGHIRCVEGGYQKPSGKFVLYTMDDLEHFVQSADALRRGCALGPAKFNYRLPEHYVG